MKPRKPDRWERLAEKLSLEGERITGYDVVELLRKEHRAVMRIVKAEIKNSRKLVAATLLDDPKHVAYLARWTQCVEILDHLTRRAT